MKAILLSLALAILMGPLSAQTPAQVLEKGIFAQETEGNLDNAILLYRQVVNSATNQRGVAAQAQYRLAQALLQKEDLKTAAQEFERLARDYSDYQGLVSSLSGQVNQSSTKRAVLVTGSGVFVMNTTFDENKKVTVTGKAIQVTVANPAGSIMIDDGSRQMYSFVTASARAMTMQGITKDSIKPEDTVTINGVLAARGQMFDNAVSARADQVVVNGKTIFDRALVPQELTLTPEHLATDQIKILQSEITELKAKLDSMRGHVSQTDPELREAWSRLDELKRRLQEALVTPPQQ